MAKIYVLPYYRKGLSNSITSSGQLKQHRATLKVNLGVELNKNYAMLISTTCGLC